ncbi:MAG TPA: protein translocase subunit SecF [Candidatus Methanoperedenaceae archaeon]|nr:protein translocase subunit SecF [Candidatus Methanoperedenaceae archaeon]
MDADKLINDYIDRTSPKMMVILPLIVLLFSLGILAFHAYTSPENLPLKLGMEFTGGTVVTINTDETPQQLLNEFSDFPIVNVREAQEYGNRKLLQFSTMDDARQKRLNQIIDQKYSGADIKHVGEIFGRALQQETVRLVLLSFLLMAIIVFVFFRTFVPSTAVILSAFSDIVFAAAMMDVVGMRLSMGTVAALLMLIGYSVDTDMLLTTRLLKRTGELKMKIREAMKTGLTMTLTTLAALVVMFAVSTGAYIIVPSFSRIDIVSDISTVLIFGLIADILNTWMLNTGILRLYLERRGEKV